jgi:hypothetical protein
MGGRSMRLSPCSGAVEVAWSQFNMTFGAGVASRASVGPLRGARSVWLEARARRFPVRPPLRSACSGRTASTSGV